MSLAAIKTFFWKSSEEMVLNYSKVEPQAGK
jgi:hypothetical protein